MACSSPGCWAPTSLRDATGRVRCFAHGGADDPRFAEVKQVDTARRPLHGEFVVVGAGSAKPAQGCDPPVRRPPGRAGAPSPEVETLRRQLVDASLRTARVRRVALWAIRWEGLAWECPILSSRAHPRRSEELSRRGGVAVMASRVWTEWIGGTE